MGWKSAVKRTVTPGSAAASSVSSVIVELATGACPFLMRSVEIAGPMVSSDLKVVLSGWPATGFPAASARPLTLAV